MVIGVTGGVGAGKSTVLKILQEKYGAKILFSDDIAKELMEPGKSAYTAVVKTFGPEILEDECKDCHLNPAEKTPHLRRIDREKLAKIVFADEEKLALLNSLTHPAVKEEILSRIASYYAEDKNALIVVEAALLIEAGYEDILDSLWVVYVEKEERISRLMRDRGYSREKALSIMENQLSDEVFKAHADFLINNTGTHEETQKQIEEFFDQ